MLVEDRVIVENKTLDRLLPIHEAQLLTYLKLRDCRLGFLLNWNVRLMKHGIKRMVNNLYVACQEIGKAKKTLAIFASLQ